MLSIARGGFTHTQSTPSSTWVIDHSMGRNPIVDVVVPHNGSQEVILPLSITFPTTSQVVISFSMPYTGTARLG